MLMSSSSHIEPIAYGLQLAYEGFRGIVSRPELNQGRGPSPLWPMLEKFVREECEKLERNHITPWAFLLAGPRMVVKDYYGGDIAYGGIGFEGSPQNVFWTRYIEPFLEDITFRAVDYA